MTQRKDFQVGDKFQSYINSYIWCSYTFGINILLMYTLFGQPCMEIHWTGTSPTKRVVVTESQGLNLRYRLR